MDLNTIINHWRELPTRTPIHTYNEIDYKCNKNGFREDEFTLENFQGLTIGCSHTYGEALHEQDCYVRKLETYTGQRVWNFGMGGTSVAWVYRSLYQILKIKKPDWCVVQLTYPNRYEMWDEQGNSHQLLPTDKNKYIDFYKVASNQFELHTWLKYCVMIEQMLNHHRINHVMFTCQGYWDPTRTKIFRPRFKDHTGKIMREAGIQSVLQNSWFEMLDHENGNVDRALDNLHHGPICHDTLAQYLHKELKERNFI
jgi:hypothetical protein